MKFYSLILMFLIVSILSATEITGGLVGSGRWESVITIESSDITISKDSKSGFSTVFIEGFDSQGGVGMPQLPHKSFSLMHAENSSVNIDVRILEADTIRDITVIPAAKPYSPELGTVPDLSRIAGEVYEKAEWFPVENASAAETRQFCQVPVTTVSIAPVRFNPVTKTCIVAKRITVNVSYSPFTGTSALSSSRKSLVKNSVENFPELTSARAVSTNGNENIIIITVDGYTAALAPLVQWQKMKGFEVSVISKSSWTTAAVTDSVKNRYNNTTPKPGYLLIVGDNSNVPGIIQTAEDNRTYYSDHPYVCLAGDDNFGEMSRGRIPVSSAAELSAVVDKIVEYETEPATNASFYTTALASSFFDGDASGTEKTPFVERIEQARTHLEAQGINSDREYYAYSSVSPQAFESGLDPAGDFPDELLRSNGFGWDSDASSIADKINDGRFLVYHYDHGYASGWGLPSFRTGNLSSLTNVGMYPVMLSIDCWVGNFSAADNFATDILLKEQSGVSGLVAASCYTTTGHNDALLLGLIDAVWPGTYLNSIYVNKSLDDNDPVYRMGDVLTQGLYRMEEQWNNPSYYTALNKRHSHSYHWFGDPTMEIWTEVPKTINVSHAGEIDAGASSYSLSSLNVTGGIATLYSLTSGNVVAAGTVSSSSLSLSITESVAGGDTLLLTVNTHNFRPVIDTIIVSTPVVTDTESPEVSVISPSAGESLEVGDTAEIVWSATDNVGVTSIKITFTIDGGSSWSAIKTLSSNSGTYSWIVPDAVSSDCKIRIKAFDAAGNSKNATTDAFSIDLSTAAADLLLKQKGISVQRMTSGVKIVAVGEKFKSVSLVSLSGRVVYMKNNMTIQNGSMVIPFKDIAKGFYLLQIAGAKNKVITHRLMIR